MDDLSRFCPWSLCLRHCSGDHTAGLRFETATHIHTHGSTCTESKQLTKSEDFEAAIWVQYIIHVTILLYALNSRMPDGSINIDHNIVHRLFTFPFMFSDELWVDFVGIRTGWVCSTWDFQSTCLIEVSVRCLGLSFSVCFLSVYQLPLLRNFLPDISHLVDHTIRLACEPCRHPTVSCR